MSAAAAAVELTAEEAALARELTAAELAAAPAGSLPFEAWYMDDSQEDQRLPHRCSALLQRRCRCCRALQRWWHRPCWLLGLLGTRAIAAATPLTAAARATASRTPRRLSPNQPCPPEELYALGCRVWALDADAYPADPQLAAIRKARGYNYDVSGVGAPMSVDECCASVPGQGSSAATTTM